MTSSEYFFVNEEIELYSYVHTVLMKSLLEQTRNKQIATGEQ